MYKYTIQLCIILLFITHISQAQVVDNFDDGDFTANPIWGGDTDKWTIDVNKLRSNSAVANSSFYLSTSSTKATDAQWELSVNLQFNTSSTNLVDIYLTADNTNLTAVTNGYFVRIGDTADEISLFKKVAGVNTKIIDGTDGITNFTNNTLKIKVTRNAANLWTLQRDITGSGNNYVVENTVNDNALNTSSFFGILVKQSTNTFFNKHFFDDIYVGDIILDVTAPTIKTVDVISATQLDITFSESVDVATSQTLTNYSVNNGLGNPTNAVRDNVNFALVHLTFGNNFPDGIQNTISTSNVTDLSANVIAATDKNFTYFAPLAPLSREIVINEILADPTNTDGVVGLPNAEFVELYNTTANKVFNLKNYTLNGKLITNSNYFLLPDQYVILCPVANLAEFQIFGSAIGLASWDALTNTGEAITLLDNLNNVVDKITYSDSWYTDSNKKEGGWSLEQVNPLAPCSDKFNWKASNNPQGGSPAAKNSVFDNTPDQKSPEISGVTIIAPNKIQVIFNESMDENSLLNGTYLVNNGITVINIFPILPDKNTVELTFDNNLVDAVPYTITLQNLKDCVGNLLIKNIAPFGIGMLPKYNELIITEFMADPSPIIGMPEVEYIEIYNRTDKVIDLSKCTLGKASNQTVAKFPAMTLSPNEYLIVCTGTAVEPLKNFGKVIGLTNFPSLNNTGDDIFIKSANTLIFEVNYSDTWYKSLEKKEGGWSLEMIDTANPCGEVDNWIASESPTGGTPGKINSIVANNPDLTAPQLLKAIPLDNQTIEISFNEKMDSTSLINGNYSFNNNITKQSVQVIGLNFKKVLLKTNEPLQPKILYTLTITNVQDCSGNLIQNKNQITFALPEKADSLDILLSEVLFNPRSGGVDFVELYNNSDKYIDLINWKLANADGEGNVDNIVSILAEAEHYILNPKSYVAITSDPEILFSQYPQSKKENFLASNIPSYNDDDGSVILINEDDKIMERFDYNEDFHFSLLDDNEGVSLERTNFALPVNEPTNWFSAASTVGYATPGGINSQQRDITQNTGTLTIEPRVFTPDGDGHFDFTTINYNFPTSGNTATISIYDIKGREIKKIAQNHLLATKGTYIWDGSTTENQKVSSGYYIVLVQVFNLNGGQQNFKERVIIGLK